MFTVFTYFIGFAITYPIVISIIGYLIAKKVSKSKRKAIHISVNFTTALYIISVCVLLKVIFGQSYSGWILIFLLALLSIAITYQWKTKDEIVFRNAWKVFWRFSFLLFLFCHICLVVLGLGISIASV